MASINKIKPGQVLYDTFFGVSTAAFEFAKKINEALGRAKEPTEMELLHIKANIEANKENPDMEVLDGILLEMENLAAKNIIKAKFESGGFYKPQSGENYMDALLRSDLTGLNEEFIINKMRPK